MEDIRIYRVKAVQGVFESVWYFDKNECRKIINHIKNDELSSLMFGTEFEIETNVLRA